jgi:hypothetical protein
MKKVRMKKTWTVAVVYEDTATREAAMTVCDHLVEQFWREYHLDVGWWSWAALQGSDSAKEACSKAVVADLIIFAASPERELPFEVVAWMETWLSQRGEREGALLGLLVSRTEESGASVDTHLYLRSAAHKAGMDYLTELPQNIASSVPDSLDSYTARAEEVTSVLDEILHKQKAPPHTLF